MIFTLLIAEDDAVQAKLLARIAAEAGCDVVVVSDGDAALAELRGSPPDALFTDLRLPGADGLALIAAAREVDAAMPVILATGYATAHNAVEAFHLGVMDVLFKPLELDALRLTFKRLRENLAQRRRIDQLTAQLATHTAPPLMHSRAPAMKQCLQLAAQVADKELPVLLEGETGAGKGVVAAHIHGLSNRRDGAFLNLNCGALPATLLESELFGFEKGAFSGAIARKPGLLELAHGGTLFLDEINSTSLDAQTRLLQFIQDRRLMRLGGVKPIEVDVRLILAANRPLKDEVAAGRFRQDLYFRVNIFPIPVPPLRARREDIPVLSEYFLARHGRALNPNVHGLAPETLERLVQYDWPGNVRELEGAIQRALVLAGGEILAPADLPADLRPVPASFTAIPWPTEATLEAVEDFWLRHVLDRCGGNRTQASRQLGIDPSTLWRKLKEQEG
ncbi:MAG: sigma-54-dependent Fis family transcriptional regulator [Hydrogenophilales bacterium CG17_big_fil_post_rev_8_21_14_2_50_63_12]|nr:MAG: sigma-54-dependent Fis family transcriptional regulator [Hydrogenophilales bacterium CG17_big_fil_post_rev_8_21_14_2_50_63_12]PIX97242.1 MAG: sigma-54-dependent Fis family transcriptional regulator [Hydrogenophilales bacterium CG_4_10_14_3_um_filter_63_21]